MLTRVAWVTSTPASAATRRQSALDVRAATPATLAVVIVLLLVYVGSGRLRWFDAALAGYLLGTLLAVFAVVYRYLVWLHRPPTARLNRRGWEAFRRRGARTRNVATLGGLVGTNLLAQRFIRHRSRVRWVAHQLVFWGCLLAVAVTFPLTFGWLHFESVGQDGQQYEAYLFDVGTLSFDSRSLVGFVVFHVLNVAAVLVIAGVMLFLARRLRDPGALATERSGDFLALAGLFAVSVTGLFLTVSSVWLEGRYYGFLNTLHAVTVILGLLYIPFGKLFHIFQRPANVGVAFYKQAGEEDGGQPCRACGTPFASSLQVGDLEAMLPQLGFDYSTDDGDTYQRTCPPCRRRLVTRAQSSRVGGFG
jgi:hypothetical protein